MFTRDARFDISADVPGGILHGPAAILAAVQPALATCVSVHHGHCPEISLSSPTTAQGVWAMEDRLRWDDATQSPIAALHGYGHYHESYRKIDGDWRIAALTLTRLRVDVTAWPTA